MQTNPAANYSWWDSLGLRDKNETKFLRKGTVRLLNSRTNNYSRIIAVWPSHRFSFVIKSKILISQVKLATGDNYYSDEQNEKMDQLCRDKFEKHGLHFTYDL